MNMQYKPSIREFRSTDYENVARLLRQIQPHHACTAKELAREDDRRESKYQFRRWVAECNGNLVAYGGYTQQPETYQLSEYLLIGGVDESHRNQGIGAKLFNTVLDQLNAMGAAKVLAHIRADRVESIRFLEKRGFCEFWRIQDWELNLQQFEPDPYAGIVEKVRRSGIKIMSYSQLESDPERDRKFYDLIDGLYEDIPRTDSKRRHTLEEFIEEVLACPQFIKDGHFIALSGGEYVGKTGFNTWGGQRSLFTELTCVKRRFRRKGIALALKVRAIKWAQERDYLNILTDNECHNLPMLALNEKLGFRKLPAWNFYKLILSGD
jgi:GNAT superfamily N-acetyltransferase